MTPQQTLNKLKRIIDELFDLHIKKQLDGLDANDKKRINQIKEDVVKIETAINAKGIKISVIQKAIQVAKELIEELGN